MKLFKWVDIFRLAAVVERTKYRLFPLYLIGFKDWGLVLVVRRPKNG